MKIAFAGDLVLQNLNKQPEFIFSEIKSLIDEEDLFFCINLESPFIQEAMTPKKQKITLYSYPEQIKHLKFLNPQLVNISNNHINDYGNESSLLTIENLKHHSLNCFGVGYNSESKNLFIDQENKIIHLAYTDYSADLTGSKMFCSEDFIGPYSVNLNEIRKVKEENTEFVLAVHLHWGIEDITYPEPEKRKLGYAVIDAGADIIIGHHPHIVQPVEYYNDKTIFYSLGNFYFPEIKYYEKGVLKTKKRKPHQNTGLVPIFQRDSENLVLSSIVKIRQTKDGRLITMPASVLKLTLSNGKLYKLLFRINMSIRELTRLTIYVLLNPHVINKKIKEVCAKRLKRQKGNIY